MNEKKNEIILFENQGVKLEVNLKDETVWLTQKQWQSCLEKIEEQLQGISKTYIKMKNWTRIQYAHFLSILLKMGKNIQFNIIIST